MLLFTHVEITDLEIIHIYQGGCSLRFSKRGKKLESTKLIAMADEKINAAQMIVFSVFDRVRYIVGKWGLKCWSSAFYSFPTVSKGVCFHGRTY